MREDEIYLSNRVVSEVYLNMKNIVYYYIFANDKLYCESYFNLDGYEHNLFGAAVVYYTNNVVKVLDKYYYINNKHIKIESDLEFYKYVKVWILK
jgi:hypothetical protein